MLHGLNLVWLSYATAVTTVAAGDNPAADPPRLYYSVSAIAAANHTLLLLPHKL
jgi:hypothetical protein